MQCTRADLDTLCAIAQEAGREIMAVYAGDITAWEKDDASPLTQADLRADAAIRAGLGLAFPGVFILSEESQSPGTCGDTFFLVDPLDGTKEFLKRNGEFTVNIALVVEGCPVAGVVHAPALDETFFATRGVGAFKRTASGETPLRVAACDTARGLRVMGSRSHGGDALQAWLAGLDATHSFVAAGSSLKFCRIAEGLADAYPRHGPTCQWDTAAAQAVLEQAGGRVLDGTGQPLRYGPARPTLNPHFIAVGDSAWVLPPL